MMPLGQFSNGPIQFGDDNQIEARGTIDSPPPSAPVTTPTPAPSPTGGGVLPVVETNRPPPSQMPQGQGPQPEPDEDTSMSARVLSASPFGSIDDQARSFRPGMAVRDPFTPFQTMGGLGGGGRMGQASFDDGGMIDSDQTGTVDPMNMFKQVLAHGRQQMGLPADFSKGPEEQAQSFDDGGMIPEQPDVTADGNEGQGNPNAVDPRKTLSYLSGAGAVSPEVAGALERHVDPQGSMQPDERVMASIQKAPTPEAKFGLMQHYRTQFNGFAGGARAALAKGDMGQAAMHATQAFANIPTGQSVSFAPAGNGRIALVVRGKKQTPQPQSQSFEEGGEVEDDTDNTGAIPAPKKREDPTALARDGMRKFMGAGLLGKAPVKAGDEAWEKYHGDGGTMSMDDGGEVEDDTDEGEQQGVLPETPASGTDQMLAEHDAEGAAVDAQQQDQTHVLTPDQFNKVLTSYDAPVDEGLSGFIGKLLGSLAPNGAQAAPAMKDSYEQSKGWLSRALKGPQASDEPSASGSVEGPGGPPAMGAGADATPSSPEPYRAAKGGVFDTSGATRDLAPSSGGDQSSAKKKLTFDDSDQRYEHALDRAKKLASQLFPWSSQESQRSQYVSHMMDKFEDTEGKSAIEESKGRTQIAAGRDKAKMDIEVMREGGRNARAGDAHRSREEIARINNAWKALNAGQQQQIKMYGQYLAANPGADPGTAQRKTAMVAQSMGLDPQHLLALAQAGGPLQAEQEAAPQQQGAGQSTEAAASRFKTGEKYDYTDPKDGKTYTYTWNGAKFVKPVLKK